MTIECSRSVHSICIRFLGVSQLPIIPFLLLLLHLFRIKKHSHPIISILPPKVRSVNRFRVDFTFLLSYTLFFALQHIRSWAQLSIQLCTVTVQTRINFLFSWQCITSGDPSAVRHKSHAVFVHLFPEKLCCIRNSSLSIREMFHCIF